MTERNDGAEKKKSSRFSEFAVDESVQGFSCKSHFYFLLFGDEKGGLRGKTAKSSEDQT